MKIYVENEKSREEVIIDINNEDELIYVEQKKYSLKELIDIIKKQDKDYHKLAKEYDKLDDEFQELMGEISNLQIKLHNYENGDCEEDYYEELKINELI